MNRFTVSLIEDDPHTLALWKRFLRAQPDFDLIGAFPTAEAALGPLRANPPSLMVVDWKLPGMDGIELIRQTKDFAPEVRSILMTAHDLDALPFAAFTAGADGFLLKPVGSADFLRRLREVCAGQCPVSASVARLLVNRLLSLGAMGPSAGLSKMEVSVLSLFGEGLDTKTVADRLNLSLHTVVTHKRRLFGKLGAHNLAGALNRWHGGGP